MTTTNQTRVVHINDHIEGAVYIGRASGRARLKASKWANPNKIGAPSYQGRGLATRDILSRQQVLERYWRSLVDGEKRHLLADLPELRNIPALLCWCRHDGEARTVENECHGDILVELLDTYTDDELREMAQAATTAQMPTMLPGLPTGGNVIALGERTGS